MSIGVMSNFPSGGGNNLKPRITSAQYKEIEIGTSLYWYRVAYGNGVFVAIGAGYENGAQKQSNKYIYSTDGENWSEGTLPVTSYWYQVDFIKDRFYIANNVGYQIYSSKDGVHWETILTTKMGNGQVSAAAKIVYGNGVFVAIGTSTASKGYIAYSYDTKTWYVVEQPYKDKTLKDICYGNGIFIATPNGASNQYIYSYDGKRWKIATLDIDNTYILRSYVTYGVGKFIINIQFSTNASVETQKNMCFTSEDGLNWKKIELFSETSSSGTPVRLQYVNYINGMFFITTNSWFYYYSYDGENWKTAECHYGVGRTNTVFGKGKFVNFRNSTTTTNMNKSYYLEVTTPPEDAVYLGNASDDDKLLSEYSTSINSGYGTSGNAERIKPQIGKWQSVDINTIGEGKSWTGIAYGLGMYIAIEEGENSESYYISEDGYKWEKRTFNLGIRIRRYIAFVNDRFFVFEENRNIVEYSTDGITWSNFSIANELLAEYCAYGMHIYLFGGKNYNGFCYDFVGTSATSIKFAAPLATGWSQMAYGQNKFVLLNYNTNDKVIITQRNTGSSYSISYNMIKGKEKINNYCGIAYGNGKFVAISNETGDKFSYCSGNINEWKIGYFPHSVRALSIAYGNGVFLVTVYNSDKYLYSYDGIEWLEGELNESYQYAQVFAVNDGFIIANDAATRDVNYKYSKYQIATVSAAPQTETFLGTVEEDDILDSGAATSIKGYDMIGKGVRAYPEPIGYTTITGQFRSIVSAIDIVYDENQKKIFTYLLNDMVEKSTDNNGKWEAVESGTSNLPIGFFYSNVLLSGNVAYHDGKYVAVRSYNQVYKSTDGKKWTNTGISASNIRTVKWLNDRFVVIDRNKFLYSIDGETFTESSRSGLKTSNGYWQDVAYGNGVYVAIFWQTDSSNATIAYSTDNCASWTQKTLSSTVKLRCIAYGNGIFVAIGISGQEYFTSTDGVNWTSRTTLPSSGNTIQNNCITFVSASESSAIGNLFVIGKGQEDNASNYNPTSTYYTSTDGISWTARSWGISGHCQTIKLCNGKLYALFYRSSKLLSSTNGTSWSSEELNYYTYIVGAAYGNNRLLVLTEFGGISVSTDGGNSWSISRIPWTNMFDTEHLSMAYGKGVFLISGYYTTTFINSESNSTYWTEDGVSFTKTNIATISDAVYFLGGMFFLTKTNNTYYYSYDGKNLEKGTFPISFTNKVYMAYGNGIYVAATENLNGLAYSIDGVTWTNCSIPIFSGEATLHNLVYGNGYFLGCINEKEMIFSSSGTGWSIKENVTKNGNAAIRYLNGIFYNGEYYSYNLANNIWKKQKHNTIIFDSPCYTIIGNNQMLLYTWNKLYLETVRTAEYYTTYLGNATAADIVKGKRATNQYGYSIEGTAEKVGSYPIETKNITGNIEYVSNPWRDMEYGNGIFLTVGISMMGSYTNCISSNGTSWKPIKASATSNYICFGNGKFVFFNARHIYISTDGTHWKTYNNLLPTAANNTGLIKYLNNQFIIAGGNVLYYSTDGENWKQSNRNGITTMGAYWRDIAYGNGIYVMIYLTGSTGTIAYSTDLENWTEKNIGSFIPYRIAYGNGKFVIICNNSTTTAYSTDGINWTVQTGAMDTNIKCQTLGYENNLFIAAGGSFGVNTYYTSSDGISWTKRSFPISRGTCYSVKYRNNYWYAVFGEEYRILRSSDGINWNSYILYTYGTSFTFQEIAYGNGILLVQGQYSEWFKSTDQGKSWTRKEFSTAFNNAASSAYHRLIFGNGIFSLVHDNTNKYYSRDGESWTKISASLSGLIANVFFANNMFFYLRTATNISYWYTSSDGITLTQRSIPFTVSTQDTICYGAGKYVFWKRNASAAAYSTDGINWTLITVPSFSSSSKNIYQMAYGNGKFLACVSTTEMITSTDGINWSVIPNNIKSSQSIFFINGVFVNGSYYYSYDGLNWILSNAIRKQTSGSNFMVKLWENTYAWGGGYYIGVMNSPAEDAYYLGNARPEDIPKGITFSSIHGYGLVGTKE